jgi:outer membrane protein
MRGLAFGVAAAVMLAGSLSSAQTPTQPPPTQPPPTAPQKPVVPLAPTNQTPPTPARPPKPFPEGAKIGYVVLQRIANESVEGKAATSKIQALQQKKSAEMQDKQKQLQGLQQKLEKEGSVMSSTAHADVQKQIERLQVEIQRFTQDAQQEIQDLTTQLQGAFEQRMTPILGEVGQEKGLHFIFNAPDSGIVWADPGLDITADVIKRLDAAKPPVKQ